LWFERYAHAVEKHCGSREMVKGMVVLKRLGANPAGAAAAKIELVTALNEV
jgi:hypothetical protein